MTRLTLERKENERCLINLYILAIVVSTIMLIKMINGQANIAVLSIIGIIVKFENT